MTRFNLQNILLIIGILLILILIFSTDYKKIYHSVLESNKSYFLISGLLISLGMLIRSGKIYIILGIFKNSVSRERCFAYYVNSAFFANIIPGHLGEAIIAALIKKNDKIDMIKALPLLFADKFLDFIVLFSYFIISTNFLFVSLNQLITLNYIGKFIFFILIFIILLFLILKNTAKIVNLHGKAKDYFLNFKYGFTELIRTPKKAFFLVILTLIGWLPEFGGFYFSMKAFGIDITYLQLVFLHTSAIFAGMISMIPGGIGSTELSVLLLSIQLGFSQEKIIAATLLYRLVTYISLIVWMVYLKKYLSLDNLPESG